MFDGWTCAREHYIAFFVTWTTNEGNVETRPLCCGVQDLPNEDVGETADSFGLTAANSALLKYNKSFENLQCKQTSGERIAEWYRINKNIDRVLPFAG